MFALLVAMARFFFPRSFLLFSCLVGLQNELERILNFLQLGSALPEAAGKFGGCDHACGKVHEQVGWVAQMRQ